jgi:hypothetical protein
MFYTLYENIKLVSYTQLGVAVFFLKVLHFYMKNIKLVPHLSMQHESLVWHDWMVEFMIWTISLVVRFVFQGVCADQLDRFDY